MCETNGSSGGQSLSAYANGLRQRVTERKILVMTKPGLGIFYQERRHAFRQNTFSNPRHVSVCNYYLNSRNRRAERMHKQPDPPPQPSAGFRKNGTTMGPPFWEFPPHPIPLRRLRVVSAAVLRLPRPRWTAFARNGNVRQ